MSGGRALTNLTGNGIGTLVIARWTGQLDRERLQEVLDNPSLVDPDRLLAEKNAAAAAQPPIDALPAK